MRGLVRSPRDLLAGLLFAAFGLVFVVVGQDYPMGTTRRMGPAFLPVILGGLLTAIGVAIAVRALVRDGPPLAKFSIGPLALIVGAAVAFGWLLPRAGLIGALVVLVLIAAAASRQVVWWQAVALAAFLVALSAIVFTWSLGLPLPLLGTWRDLLAR